MILGLSPLYQCLALWPAAALPAEASQFHGHGPLLPGVGHHRGQAWKVPTSPAPWAFSSQVVSPL